ncbi:MAG: hypothetical protein ACREQ5_05225, partial [Candidatus Dormibacteria bacterium]
MTPQGTIYLDMDGTIVDFISGANQILKQPWNSSMTKEHRQARNKRIFEDGGVQFWINLRPLPDFHLLWDFVKPFSPHILSAVPHGVETGYLDKKAATNACEGKWDWVKRHCPSIPHEH